MKRKTVDGLEQDVVYARGLYCYLANNSALVKFTKRKINKRERREGRKAAQRAGEDE